MKIASWNGKKWLELGSGFRQGKNDGVLIKTMTIYKGELYAGGNFHTVNGYSSQCMAKWNGMEWIPVGGNAIFSGEINALAVYKDELYAGGRLSVAFEERNLPQWMPVNIAKWNGNNWVYIGEVVGNKNDPVYTLAVYNKTLYAGGSFISVNGKPAAGIACYDGNKWMPLACDITGGTVEKLVVHQGELYLIGDINRLRERNCATNPLTIYRWNEKSLLEDYGDAEYLYSYHENLFRTTTYYPNHDTTLWLAPYSTYNIYGELSTYDSPDSARKIGAVEGIIKALAVHDGILYIGGEFTGKGFSNFAQVSGKCFQR